MDVWWLIRRKGIGIARDQHFSVMLFAAHIAKNGIQSRSKGYRLIRTLIIDRFNDAAFGSVVKFMADTGQFPFLVSAINLAQDDKEAVSWFNSSTLPNLKAKVVGTWSRSPEET